MARMRLPILTSTFMIGALASCSSPERVVDSQRVAQCASLLQSNADEILSRPATQQLSALKDAMPEDCQSTDAYKTVQAGVLIDLGRIDDAGEKLGEIDLMSTGVPRALELAYILAVEGGWKSPVEPKLLAQRYIDGWPDSPIGYVILARELNDGRNDREMLNALEQGKRLVTPETERAFLAHLVTFAGYYADFGDYVEAYRLSHLLFSLYGDDVWVRDGSVVFAAKAALMVGRRDEARLIMDRLVARNPQAAMSSSAMSVFKELIEQKFAPRATLPPDQPTIESLLREQRRRSTLTRSSGRPQVPHFTLEFRLLGSSESEAGRGFAWGKRQSIAKAV